MSDICLGDDVAGTVTWSDASDFPWAHGPFEAGPALAALEPWLDADEHGDEHLAVVRLEAAGVAGPGALLLRSPDKDDRLVALVLRDGRRHASWRIGIGSAAPPAGG